MEIWANSGSPSDIQIAVNQALTTGADIIRIPDSLSQPDGVFWFDPTVNANNVGVSFILPTWDLSIIGAGKDKTILQLPLGDSVPAVTMFKIAGGYETSRTIGGWHSGGRLRFTGISLRGRPNWQTSPTDDNGLILEACKDFRVDNSAFRHLGSISVAVSPANQYGIVGGDPARISTGLIDHCDFLEISKPMGPAGSGYGVMVSRAAYYLWTYWENSLWDVYGKYLRNVFIEDCYFRGCRHSVAASNGGMYTFRFNIIENGAQNEWTCTGHPNRNNYNGCQGYEAYSNILRKTTPPTINAYRGFLVEGGSALIYDNQVSDVYYCVGLGNCEYQTSNHPVGHQNNVYIWNNNPFSSWWETIQIWDNGTGCATPVEGVSYFLHEPPVGTYTGRYQYPHPLTLEAMPSTHTLTVNSNINGVPFNIRKVI